MDEFFWGSYRFDASVMRGFIFIIKRACSTCIKIIGV